MAQRNYIKNADAARLLSDFTELEDYAKKLNDANLNVLLNMTKKSMTCCINPESFKIKKFNDGEEEALSLSDKQFSFALPDSFTQDDMKYNFTVPENLSVPVKNFSFTSDK